MLSLVLAVLLEHCADPVQLQTPALPWSGAQPGPSHWDHQLLTIPSAQHYLCHEQLSAVVPPPTAGMLIPTQSLLYCQW